MKLNKLTIKIKLLLLSFTLFTTMSNYSQSGDQYANVQVTDNLSNGDGKISVYIYVENEYSGHWDYLRYLDIDISLDGGAYEPFGFLGLQAQSSFHDNIENILYNANSFSNSYGHRGTEYELNTGSGVPSQYMRLYFTNDNGEQIGDYVVPRHFEDTNSQVAGTAGGADRVQIDIYPHQIERFKNAKTIQFRTRGEYLENFFDYSHWDHYPSDRRKTVSTKTTNIYDISRDLEPKKATEEANVVFTNNDIRSLNGDLKIDINLEYFDNYIPAQPSLNQNNYDHLQYVDIDYSEDNGNSWKGFSYLKHAGYLPDYEPWPTNILLPAGSKNLESYNLYFNNQDNEVGSLVTHRIYNANQVVNDNLTNATNRLEIKIPISQIPRLQSLDNVKWRVRGRYYDTYNAVGDVVNLPDVISENFAVSEEDNSGQDEIGFETSFNEGEGSISVVLRLSKKSDEVIYDHLACSEIGRRIKDVNGNVLTDELIGFVNHTAESLGCNDRFSPAVSGEFSDDNGDNFRYGLKYNSLMITPFADKFYTKSNDDNFIVIRDFINQNDYGKKIEYYVAGSYYARDLSGNNKVAFYWYNNRSNDIVLKDELKIPSIVVKDIEVSTTSDCQIDLTWDALDINNLMGITDNYFVQILRDDQEIARIDIDGGVYGYNDTNIEAGIDYKYALRIVYDRKFNSTDFSDVFGQKSAAQSISLDLLEAPAGLTSSQTGCDGDILVSWTYTINPSFFVLERQKPGEDFEVIKGDIDGSLRSYTDTNITKGVVYKYRIAAKSGADKCNAIGNFSAVYTHSKDDKDLSTLFDNSENNLETSKGYFNNRTELEWNPKGDVEQFINQYKIYTREFGSLISPNLLTTLDVNAKRYDHIDGNAGVIYEYFVVGERVIEDSDCGRQITTSFSIESLKGKLTPNNLAQGVGYNVGLRVATGVVNGNITYKGGTSVPDVKVVAERQNQNTGKSILFDGTASYAEIPYNEKISPTEEITFSLWIKPEVLEKFSVIAERQVAYGVQLSENGEAVFYIKDQVGTYHEAKTPVGTIIEGNWANITGTFNNTSKDLIIYINGKKITTTNIPSATGIFDGYHNYPLTIGRQFSSQAYHFQGNIDEIRLYNRAMSEDEVQRTFSKYIATDHNGLQGYWKVFEGLGNNIYDLAHNGDNYFKNNGKIYNTIFKDDAPAATQLGNVSYTDTFGNYTIEAIEYTGTGENFNIIPGITLEGAVHEFDPSRKTIFIGEGAAVNNEIDFEDISSFQFSGFVRFDFEDTIGGGLKTAGTKGVRLYLDGNIAITGDDNKVFETDENGFFDVQIPIGNHFIEFRRNGHTFKNSRFPEKDTHDFQESITGYIIQDETTHKFSGRVVGGIIEGDKPLSMVNNPSVNNIGQAKFTLTSEDGKIVREVMTDANTGEFTINLPPKKYTSGPVKWINDNANIIESGDIQPIDLRTILAYNGTYDTDSVYVNKVLDRIDSTFYNVRKDFIYRTAPELVVTDTLDNSIAKSGESYYQFNVGNAVKNIKIKDLPYPVYLSAKDYALKMKAVERYTNKDNSNESVTPVSDGEITINNNIGTGFYVDDQNKKKTYGSPEIISLDANGEFIYHFKTGAPNINENANTPALSFTKQMSIILKVNNEETIWKNPIDNQDTFKSYVLGGGAIGSNFITKAPAVVEYVLRDPGGSESYAYWEKGFTKTTTKEYFNGGFGSIDLHVGLGVGTNTLVGGGIVGVGEISETHLTGTLDVNVSTEIGGGGEHSTSETYSQRIETNADPTLIGLSDVFVAKSENIQTGLGVHIRPVPIAQCGSNCYGDVMEDLDGNQYKMTRVIQSYTNPKGNPTYFIFSQNHIENVLIPDLKEIRNSLFTSVNSKYTSKLSPDHELYGSNNDDLAWGNASSTNNHISTEVEDFNGSSYTFNYAGNTKAIDSVRTMNQQIRLWNEALANNEIDKWLAKKYQTADNISISGGNSLERSKTSSTSDYKYTTFELQTSLAVGLDTSFEGYGLDIDLVQKNEIGFKHSSTNGSGEENTVTTGFVIADPDDSDAHSINIYQGIGNGGTIFSTVSGQTMCPFEDKIVVKFTTLDYLDRLETALTKDIGRLDRKITAIDSQIAAEQADGGIIAAVNIEKLSREKTKVNAEKVAIADKLSKMNVLKSDLAAGEIILSNATLKRDNPKILINGAKTAQAFNVPADESANFNLSLINESQSNDAQLYAVEALDETNPNGLEMTIDGQSINSAREFLVQGGGGIQKILKVNRGPNHYDYERIGIMIKSTCQADPTSNDAVLSDTIYFNVKYLPVCTNLEINSPSENWTVNNSFNNKLPITIGDYDVNKVGFEEIKIQYKTSTSTDWTLLTTYYRNEEIRTLNGGANDAPLLPTNGNSLTYEWDLGSLPDGNYDIRALSKCALAENETEIYSGTIDRTNPTPFGLPQPSDGILSPGEEASVQFNETINENLLSPENFDIRGVLNEGEIRHTESVAFSSDTNSYVEIEQIDFASQPFTIDFYAKRDVNNTNQIIISQGSTEDDELLIGFNASNQIYFKLAGKTVTGSTAINNSWHHYAFTYDPSNTDLSIYYDTNLEVIDNSFEVDAQLSESLFLGKSKRINSNYFTGKVHELRIWSKPLTVGEVNINAVKRLIGNEAGLLHNWEMEEANGELALDKARAKHAKMNATWSVSPLGYALELFGTQDQANTTPVTFNNESDFTIELWFKSTGTEQVILSNGIGDGVDVNLSGWSVGIDSSGKPYAQSNGEKMTGSKTVNDGKWTHLAISHNARGNSVLYINAEEQGTIQASKLAGFGGSELSFGQQTWYVDTVKNTAKYFTGHLDEIRIWNAAIKQEQISRDRFNKLSGDEIGLVRYYPFENYTENSGIFSVSSTLNSQTEKAISNESITTLGAASLSQETPTIKLPRPVESVNFSYVVNNDKIIITLNTEPSKIENVLLDFTVKSVKDLNGNSIQSPIKWTAFIDRNQVIWQDNSFDLSTDYETELNFETQVVNNSGESKIFEITNIPFWLDVSPSSGTIGPLTTTPISFKVSEDVNVGEYNTDLLLTTSDFGFAEKLNINVNVKKALPADWVIDPTNFEFSMNVIGQISIDNSISRDENNLLGVFVNDQCRGIAKLTYVPSYDNYQAFLSIYSNVSFGEELEFRVWEHEKGIVYSSLNHNLTDDKFTADTYQGTAANPKLFSTSNIISSSIDVVEGWKWISFNLNGGDLSSTNNALSSLSPTNGDLIKTRINISDGNGGFTQKSLFDTYSSGAGIWYGSLSNNGGLSSGLLYKVKLSEANKIKYEGSITNPLTTPLNIVAGWNFVGYIGLANIPINEALVNFNAQAGDLIKSQYFSAIYDPGFGWLGTLKVLSPNEGYMIRTANAQTFKFPSYNSTAKSATKQSKAKTVNKAADSPWEISAQDYENNMTIIGLLDNDELNGNEGVLGAFVNGTCKGYAAPVYNKNLEKNIFFLNVGDKENRANITFKYLDFTTNIIYNVNENSVYIPDNIEGKLNDPKILTLDKGELLGNLSINVYPNPVKDNLFVNIPLTEASKISLQLFDTNGKKVYTTLLENFNRGRHDFTIKIDKLSAGVYNLVIISNNEVTNKKIIISE